MSFRFIIIIFKSRMFASHKLKKNFRRIAVKQLEIFSFTKKCLYILSRKNKNNFSFGPIKRRPPPQDRKQFHVCETYILFRVKKHKNGKNVLDWENYRHCLADRRPVHSPVAWSPYPTPHWHLSLIYVFFSLWTGYESQMKILYPVCDWRLNSNIAKYVRNHAANY